MYGESILPLSVIIISEFGSVWYVQLTVRCYILIFSWIVRKNCVYVSVAFANSFCTGNNDNVI